MNRYTKIINMMESYFTKDFEKTKKGFTKVREVKEETGLDVREAEGGYLEDSDREILIDDFSSDEDIKKYLGASFINPRR